MDGFVSNSVITDSSETTPIACMEYFEQQFELFTLNAEVKLKPKSKPHEESQYNTMKNLGLILAETVSDLPKDNFLHYLEIINKTIDLMRSAFISQNNASTKR